MLALMAQYLCIMGKKVLILVPSEVLKLDQTRCYCPNYCRVEADLYDSDVPAIYYSTFEEVLAVGVPPSTIILIDEFHDFFKLPARLTVNGISCPFLIAVTPQAIGLSATFGGAQVISDIKKLIINSVFIQTLEQNVARKLEISVTVKLSPEAIIKETVASAEV